MATEYIILEDESSEELQAVVVQYIETGWELQGGVSIAWWKTKPRGYTRNGYMYAQAMIRQTPEPRSEV
jgi:lipoprotein-anchoring transpeptidase ErfK/SrfK